MTKKITWRCIAAVGIVIFAACIAYFWQSLRSGLEGRHRLVKSPIISNVTSPSTYYHPSAFMLPPEFQNRDKASNSPAQIKNNDSESLRIPILMYHYIEPLAGNDDRLRIGLTTPPAVLEKQIETLLKSGYSFYQVRSLADWLSNPQSTPSKSVVLSFDDGYEDFYTQVFPLLKRHNIKATVYVIYDAINAPDYLSEGQIKEMLDSGLVEVGSHTLDHLYLKNLASEKAQKQIILSKTLFEKRFRVPISTFAYPFGAFSQESIDLVEKAGYRLAVSVIPGVEQAMDNRFLLRRLRPGHLTDEALLKKLR